MKYIVTLEEMWKRAMNDKSCRKVIDHLMFTPVGRTKTSLCNICDVNGKTLQKLKEYEIIGFDKNRYYCISTEDFKIFYKENT